MTQNKQQTSVEWLEEKLKISFGDEIKPLRGFFVQAKEMEKELMKGMYVEGSFAKMRYYDGLEYIDADQYYEQTYGGGEK
jgi:hypothetical protein